MSKKYHAALSFAGKQREYVAKVADNLKARGVRVFYDEHEQTYLWGKDFPQVSQKVYGGEKSHCVVIFASREYVAKPYPRIELEHALAGGIHKEREYLLVGKFDDVVLPGLSEARVYIDLNEKTPDEFADIIYDKLKELGIRLDFDEASGKAASGDASGAAPEVESRLSEEAKRRLRAAQQGDARAQVYLGNMYYAGDDVLQDHVAAAGWWRLAAEQGNADAQINLGVSYANGVGVPQDHAKAVQWWRAAAEQGHAEAQNNLGVSYAKGFGAPQDHVEAVKWYTLAAEQGVAGAQFNLGLCYAEGVGVPQDYACAAEWWRRAAEQELADAQNNLGMMCGAGYGVSQDHAEAVKWYKRAAVQGLADAQFNLGLCYADGVGVSQDWAEAKKWWRRAAKQGDANAQYNLGWMYGHGKGVQQDPVQAYKWFSIAAAQGHETAKNNAALMTMQMTLEQIAEAQGLASEFEAQEE